MNRLAQALKARTPEEQARRRFGLWALVALVVLLPAWWWIGADLAAAVLKPVAALFLRLFGLNGQIGALEDGGWAIGTDLTHADGRPYVFGMPHEMVKRLLFGVPLFAAFMIAPPRTDRPVRAVLIGAGVILVVFLLSVAGVVWGETAPMLNPALAGQAGAGGRLSGEPLHPLAAQVAILGRYLALSVAPLILAVVTWAAVNPAGRETLLGGLGDDQGEDPADAET
ncbi:MAG TPA: hypothetical protein PLQ03_12220 [Brevundimonas sp.]|mgnify:CR=1 FL=1|uniref:exosortase H-associated membrane protein n=1 Tax=Brevundimonas sp. TaxID=1871086 RepID=UPI00262B5BBF|nr:exosortase H-associated membrane protein [Brevundimonas sp.]HRO34164.1 hypothetical protein [Brevundimonas sp.]